MAQDVLGVLMEGPDEDAVYALYDDNEEDETTMEDESEEVDEEALKEAIISVEDSD
jgi:hypothetical protein